MRIAYIAAGAGGMYCGSCLHDNALAGALGRRGHEITLVPTYTPLRTDDVDHTIDQVFYGALNVYLEQKSALFRHTPGFVDRLLNSRKLLDWVSKMGGATDPSDLGDLTLSILQGEQGRQQKELERLVAWLGSEVRPEIVHLTNSMFLGMARRIRSQLGLPVLCSVQGEDLFISGLKEPYRTRVQETMRERAADVEAFVAPSRYYAELMQEFLGLEDGRIHVARLGLSLDGHRSERRQLPEGPFVVGYLARLCREKGLGQVVEAFRILAEAVGKDEVRLRLAGFLPDRERPFVDELQQRLASWGLEGAVDWVGEVDRQGKIDFFHSLHLLSVPTVYREPKGLFVLEALANSLPVVQPAHGAFPEILEATGGGFVVEPESPQALAAGWQRAMADREALAEMGRRGRQVVAERHSDDAEAEATEALYERVLRSVA